MAYFIRSSNGIDKQKCHINDNFQSLCWMKHFSFRLAVINVSSACALEVLLSTHLPTSEGWTAELTAGLSLVVPRTGFEPTRVDLA